MTDDDSPADATDSSTAIGETNSSHPALTLRAAGPATYKRRIDDSEYVDGVAIHHDVSVTLSRELRGPDEFREIVDLDQQGEPVVDRERIVDQLLASRNPDYSRAGPLEEWSMTVEGAAVDWKQLALALATDDGANIPVDDVGTEMAIDAVWILYELIDAGMTKAGASLAVLELVNEQDLRIDCEPFIDQLSAAEISDE
ncbi:hypothetical protein [Halomicrobium salinisoli]|uniref:hypothetical protein n=1 Tax=Halomicrobium salinisoli TaxID=2878391 RepID=UPI001CF04FEC|nr:hypothetical protein [Halomicrobium salinisoli]